MSVILVLETSTKVCSVALFNEDQLLGHSDFFIDKSHANILTLAIEHLLINCGKKMADLTAIAVSQGPGSYTGLRIGLATAKGLCYALNIPLIAINTLQLMTLGVIKYFPDSQYLFCPMIDARRAEVYCAVYSSKLDEIEPVQAKILESHSFRALFEHNKIVFFGDGASKSESIIESQKNSLFIHGEYPSAKNSCPLVHTKFEEKKFEAIEKFEPFYLKEFVLKKN